MRSLVGLFLLLEIYIVKTSYTATAYTISKQHLKRETNDSAPTAAQNPTRINKKILRENIQNLTSKYDWTIKKLEIFWNQTNNTKSLISFYKLLVSGPINNGCLKDGCYFNITESKINVPFQIKLNLSSANNNLNIIIIEIYNNETEKHYFGKLFVAMSEPSPVKNISLFQSGIDFLELKWIDSNQGNPNTTVDGYLVSNNISKISNKYVQKREIKVSNLTECTKYCFNISATNNANLSSKVSTQCFTTKTKNLLSVHLFNISSEYNESREIKWNYTSSSKCVYFNLSYYIKGDPEQKFHEKINSLKRSYIMKNLKYNKVYEVRITPMTEYETMNGIKIGNDSNTVKFFTGNRNIIIKNLNASMAWDVRNLKVQWDIDKAYQGNIFYYAVHIKNHSRCVKRIVYKIDPLSQVSNNSEVCVNVTTIQSQFKETIKNVIIIPNNIKSFTADVYGANVFGEEKLTWDAISFTMKAPTSKLNLILKEKGLDYLVFKWNVPQTKDPESPIMGFNITYLNVTKMVAANGTETKIDNLLECTKYCFTIEAFNDAGSSPKSGQQCHTTKTKNLGNVTLPNLTSEHKTFKLIRWNYGGSSKCQIYYNLTYWLSEKVIKVTEIITNGTSYNLTGLKLNKQYSVQISACTQIDTENGIRCSKTSNIVQFFTIPSIFEISNLKYSMDWYRNTLNISWDLNKAFENSLLYYIIQSYNSTNNCTKAAIYQFDEGSGNSVNSYLNPFNSCILKDIKTDTAKLPFNTTIKYQESENDFNITLFALSKQGLSKLVNSSIHIFMEKPNIIRNITLDRKGLHYLKLKWDAPGSESIMNNKPIKGYSLKWNDHIRSFNSNVAELNGLNICTEYCFTVNAFNNIGPSDSSSKMCFTTQASDLSTPTLNNISSEYKPSRSVSWRYLGSLNCSVSFRLEYGIINSTEIINSSVTNAMNYTVDNLQMNEIYSVRVQPTTRFDTPNGTNEGPFSNSVKFYTGVEKINVQDFEMRYDSDEHKFLLSWNVNTTLNQYIQGYMILIKNSSKVCLSALELLQIEFPRVQLKSYKREKKTLFDKHNCIEPLSTHKRSTFNESENFKFDLKVNLSISEYTVEVFVFNKLGFQIVEQRHGKIESLNKNLIIVIWILMILLVGFIIFAVVFYRDKIIIYLPFLKVISNSNKKGIKKKETKYKNKITGEVNEEKPTPVLDERFFDCNSLEEFLNKIVGFKKNLDEFSEYVDFMKEKKDVRLIQEYAKLNNLTATLEHQLHLTKFIGKSPFNIRKNRFLNILPFDQNLVFLKSKSAPDNYLNANFVPFSEKINGIEYIASQGPIETTISDFFLMIWEQKVSCIVMLTRTHEDDKFKCLQYWPDNLNEICSFGHQKEFILIKLYEKEESSHFERKFSLKNNKTNEERFIYHMHMHMWMDYSAPDLIHFQSVLMRFQDMRETIINPPFLVHCSAGVGRTGTFICLDRIIRLLNKGQKYIDVFRTVMELRASRNFMVQRNSQYIFIHEFLKFYIQKLSVNGNLQTISTV